MSSTGASTDTSMEIPGVGTIDMKLEVVTLPVSDVDRAKRFYQSLGWRLDADIAAGDAFRVVQLTPPRSQCSISFGKGQRSLWDRGDRAWLGSALGAGRLGHCRGAGGPHWPWRGGQRAVPPRGRTCSGSGPRASLLYELCLVH
jgi:catechol 2,3-dioxygenase-like lactoylglutathione lyase family enzyme